MAYPLGQANLCTLRRTAHWHVDLFKATRIGGGTPLRFSTLDRPIEHGGFTWYPTGGERYDEELAASLASGDTELIGALSPRTITPVDIQRGNYDDARIDQYVIDWRRPEKDPYLWQVWYIDEITHNGNVWRAKLSTQARFLQTSRGEVYNSTCSAVLGDDKCKAVVPEYFLPVYTVADEHLQFSWDIMGSPPAAGHYALGTARWYSGNNKGSTSRILSQDSTGLITLAVPTKFRIRIGDTFFLRAGCDGLATTCRDKFSNLINYQGNERQKNAKQLILSRGQF